MTTDLAKILKEAKMDPVSIDKAMDSWVKYRKKVGYGGNAPLLTSPESNYKLKKSHNEAAIYGLALAPATLSKHNACRYFTPNCKAGCVAYAGKGTLPGIAKARITRTEFLAEQPGAFFSILDTEVTKAQAKYGKKLAIRLNTFSDVPWEEINPQFFVDHKSVQFYDYTKWPTRVMLKNYHLTYSASEKTKDEAIPGIIKSGINVAVVFSTKRNHDLPKTYQGIKVIDGDLTDARFLDPEGVIVGLRAKGRMRTGTWKMVRKVD